MVKFNNKVLVSVTINHVNLTRLRKTEWTGEPQLWMSLWMSKPANSERKTHPGSRWYQPKGL